MLKSLKHLLSITLILTCGYAHAFIEAAKIESFDSKIMGETRKYSVRLPQGYTPSSNIKYPVLYIFDGLTNLAHTSGTRDFLIGSNEMPKVIIVAIDTNTATRALDLTPTVDAKFPQPSGGGDKTLDFVEKELMPHIEKTYNTENYKMLAGHSFGGLLTIHALQSRPKLFNAYFAFSPSLQWNNRETSAKVKAMLVKNKQLKTFFYMNIGNEGDEMKKGFDEVKAALTEHAGKSFEWHSQHMPDETHGTVPVIGQFKAFRKLFKQWMPPYELAVKGLTAIEGFYQAHSDRFGFEILPSEGLVNSVAYEFMFGEKNLAKAHQLFALNVKNFPASAAALDGMADYLEEKGELNKAIKLMEKALKLASEQNEPLDYYQQHLQRLQGLTNK